jgi:Fic family protein
MTDSNRSIEGAPYLYDGSVESNLEDLASRVRDLRSAGRLTPDALRHIRRAFRVKNIYHSNAIEGNRLTIGETRQVVELGLTGC